MDWARHDHNIHDKVVHWFSIIGKELHDSAIVSENVYNMDETGVLLQDLPKCKGTIVKRTLVTAVECIAADGRCLAPLVI